MYENNILASFQPKYVIPGVLLVPVIFLLIFLF